MDASSSTSRARGLPIRNGATLFSEMFAAMAHAAYARATKSDRHAARARELFDAYMLRNFTPGMIAPKFTGTRPPRASARAGGHLHRQELRANLVPIPPSMRVSIAALTMCAACL